MNIKGSKKKNQVLSVNIFEQQEIIAKADAINKSCIETLGHWYNFDYRLHRTLTRTVLPPTCLNNPIQSICIAL